MRALIDALCAPECEGRAAGSAGGRRARSLVLDALRRAGADPFEQPVPGCGGANVLAHFPGDDKRWIMVGAHYDHLGRAGKLYYPGADDNACAVATLVALAGALARRKPRGRGVVLAAFDAEEPPHFLQESMGSQRWVRQPSVPLERLDMMVCLELVGHALGSPGMPAAVRNSLFLLGAERSEGTAALIDPLLQREPGLLVRRVDAEVIPPLSDYAAFWQAQLPWLLLTGARNRVYHTPQDTPALLDLGRAGRVARWLETLVRALCERPEARVLALRDAGDDASTVRSLLAIAEPLASVSSQAGEAIPALHSLLDACDHEGRLPERQRAMVRSLVGLLEQGLS